ncbi:hypothetical protein BGZ65_007304, partial [Modicella reniformis]
MATLGVQMPLSDLFASSSLSSLAESARKLRAKAHKSPNVILPVSREGDLELSFSQQRLWFLAQFEGVSDTYHVPLAVHLRGDLNREAWQRTLNALFARHEALRSVFVSVNGKPQVQLLSAHLGIPIRLVDLRGSSDSEVQMDRLCTEEAKIPFNLTSGPLIRALMIQLDDNDHVFMLTQHHIISDGWSLAVLQRELCELYEAYSRDEPESLPPLSIQYPDYAAWERNWLSGERLEVQSSYWRTTMADSPTILTLPTDRPRPAQQSFAGDRVEVHLDAELTRALNRLSQEHGVTMFMTVLTAWSVVLSRLSGQDDIIIGSPTANRNHHQLEPLLGFFVNTLALRIDLSGELTIRQLFERVRSCTIGAQAHGDLPFEQVVDIVQPTRSTGHSPLFQVMFAWQNNDTPEWRLSTLEASLRELDYNTAKFDLELEMFQATDKIVGELRYSTALFDRATIERQIKYLVKMLQEMTSNVEQATTAVGLLGSEESELLLQAWNETKQDYPDHQCIHQLFEKHVDLTPQATALVFVDQELTYAELNERANRLAHRLIEVGVKPDALVAICVERSPAMAIAVMAVLKAGGAYVPLDPSYPKDRLAYIMEDAMPTVLLADITGRDTMREASKLMNQAGHDGQVPTILDPNDQLSSPRTNPLVSGLNSRHLAYVIYTSGSTGKPKGVMIEHQGLVNLVLTRTEVFGINPSSRVLQFFSFSFDGCAQDILATLGLGAALHILPDHIRYDPTQLWEYLDVYSITQAVLTPASVENCKDLRPLTKPITLVFAGDALSEALIRRLQLVVPNGRIVNDYGPTETSVSAIAWQCPQGFSGDIVSIGRPIANKRIYILDQYCQPVPLGAMGELYIGGVGIARGYLQRPELTAERFIQDPFARDTEARMYKTGDLARYLPDGRIIFLGRNDYQVKIRGFRIELGEIEARLADHPDVQSAIVVALGEGVDKRLIAYVVSMPAEQLVYTLRSHLTSCLPDHMIPAAFVRLDALPLNPNGKIDRKALPAPGPDAFASLAYEPPQGELETTLAQIWAELLNLDR